jgi:hypothetical protein
MLPWSSVINTFPSSTAKAVAEFSIGRCQRMLEGALDLIKSNSYTITEDTTIIAIKPIAMRDNERLFILPHIAPMK